MSNKLIIDDLSELERDKLTKRLNPRLNKYIPVEPTSKQAAFLLLQNREAFYGGACGGGKSVALLMAALQYSNIPGYNAILFRRTFSELELPGALMDMAAEWLHPFKKSKEIHWSELKKRYTFPGNATLTFGYLDKAGDRLRYQSAYFHFAGFDELTHFEQTDYEYLWSRVRRNKKQRDLGIPLRVRAASNPGGPGHQWVKQRFLVEGLEKGRIFIPAVMEDNPHLDIETYDENLMELDPVTRAQLKEGDWNISGGGKIFRREWFGIIDRLPDVGGKFVPRVRYWDLAATDKDVSKVYGYRPAYTVGLRMAKFKVNNDYIFVIEDVQRFQKTPDEVEAKIKEITAMDNQGHQGKVEVWMEQEPGSAGINTINYYQKSLKGYSFRGYKETGSKVLRANRVAATAGAGKIKLLRGVWNNDFLDEVNFFPEGRIKDQVDAFSGAFDKLNNYASYSVLPIAVGREQGSYWGKV